MREIPKTLGEVADLLYTTRQERLDIQKKVEELQAFETSLKNHLIEQLPKDDAAGITGRLANVTIVVKQQPQITNAGAFRRFLQRTKRWDLAQSLKPAAPAIREMWDAGETIPGVESFGVTTVSIKKAG